MAFGRKKKERQLADPIPLGAITGSGQTWKVSSYTDATYLALLRQHWQQKVFDIYDTEGHLFYATAYVGNALSRIKLVAAKKPKEATPLATPEFIEDGPLADAVENIQSPKGGQSGLLRKLGQDVFLVGECWVIAQEYTDNAGNVTQGWEALSIDELVTVGSSGNFFRRILPGIEPKPLPPGAVAFRIWKGHPRYSEWADAGARSCLDLLEKIVILNRAEKAAGRSRLAGSGILGIPQELVPPSWQNQDKTPNPMQANPLWDSLAESMIAPLKDESAPSAVVPLVLVGPGDQVKNIKHIEINRTMDFASTQISIESAVEQVANTLEIPKEILLGISGETTRFTAWVVREDTFQAHIQPLVELVCDALTRTYLKQALSKMDSTELELALASAGVESADDLIVWYDASQLIIHPDKGDKALALHDRFAISDAALRRESGFPETDKPDELERAERIGIKMADPIMALTGEPPEPEMDQPSNGGLTGPKQ